MKIGDVTYELGTTSISGERVGVLEAVVKGERLRLVMLYANGPLQFNADACEQLEMLTMTPAVDQAAVEAAADPDAGPTDEPDGKALESMPDDEVVAEMERVALAGPDEPQSLSAILGNALAEQERVRAEMDAAFDDEAKNLSGGAGSAT